MPVTRVSESERDFQRAVIELARRRGWLVAHHHDSRRQVRRRDGSRLVVGDRDAAGLPDLIMIRDGRMIFAELKAAHGRLSEAQARWLSEVAACELCADGAVRGFCWWPHSWPEIERVLR